MDTKDCMHCKEPIHIDASRCHHCRSWQSWSGNVSRSEERAVIITFALFVGIIGAIIALHFANDYSRSSFSETPYYIKWQVLEHYPEERDNGNRIIGLRNINIFNILQAKSLASRIAESIKKDGIEGLPSCIFSRGEKCGSLSVSQTKNSLIIEKPDGLSRLSEDFGRVVLSKALRRNVKMTQTSPRKWSIHYTDDQKASGF